MIEETRTDQIQEVTFSRNKDLFFEPYQLAVFSVGHIILSSCFFTSCWNSHCCGLCEQLKRSSSVTWCLFWCIYQTAYNLESPKLLLGPRTGYESCNSKISASMCKGQSFWRIIWSWLKVILYLCTYRYMWGQEFTLEVNKCVTTSTHNECPALIPGRLEKRGKTKKLFFFFLNITFLKY